MYQRKIKIYAEGNNAIYRMAYIIGKEKGGKLAIWKDAPYIHFAIQGVSFWWHALAIDMKWLEQVINVLKELFKGE